MSETVFFGDFDGDIPYQEAWREECRQAMGLIRQLRRVPQEVPRAIMVIDLMIERGLLDLTMALDDAMRLSAVIGIFRFTNLLRSRLPRVEASVFTVFSGHPPPSVLGWITEMKKFPKPEAAQ